MSSNMWRPSDWWNPFDNMTVRGKGMVIDLLLNPLTGEKMSVSERDMYKKTIEFGANMMLEELSGLGMRDIARVMNETRDEIRNSK